MLPTDYDAIANAFDAYDADAKTDIELGHGNIVRLLRFTGDCRGLQILDFGCGTGKVSRYLAKCGAKVIGVDISQREIDIALRHEGSDNIHYRSMTDGYINFIKSESQDAVVLSFVLCAIPSREEIVRVLKMCARVLKKNGQLVILNNNMETGQACEFVSFAMPRLENPKAGDLVQVALGKDRSLIVNDFFWSQDDYASMIEEAGLTLTIIFEPMATHSDGWLDESKRPPFKLFSAYKF